ncbi:16S rRNA (uracil(1498)-N(3))-methyltransferase [Egicoccus sp. AB-alg2]|uniref:RsmE family RNA methyltransferase n=1 Tax=Egicoccus sp. AB-alg2 TaxID=3242693 RepID=UPI00359D8D0A
MSLTPYVHVDASLAGAPAGHEVVLDEVARRHLATVLRLSPGAACHLADGAGSHAPAVLTASGARLAETAVTQPTPAPRLVVAQALAKGRKFDDVVRLGTELGADGFLPVVAARSVVRIDGKTDRVVARWLAVARAAAEQSRRPFRPDVAAPVRPADLAARAGTTLLVAHPGGSPLHRRLEAIGDEAELVLAVGPEGGWTDEEVEGLCAAGAIPVGLGPAVLRTEHAAAAGLAVLGALTGRWDS